MSSQSIFLVVLFLLLTTNSARCCYNAIFSFGDSLTDTGNDLYATSGSDPISYFPYGITYFHRPTGRFSDGRIILDFIASAFDLPMVQPYLPAAGTGNGEVFRYGANFAVGGATALDNSYFINKGMEITWTEYSLSVQIRELKQLLPLLSSDSSDALSKSLVILGEIGGNDYIHSMEQNLSLDELKAMVPTVISVISSAIDTMIELGAIVIIAPGVTPFGCTAFLLTKYQSNRTEDYDAQTGCLDWINELARYHNHLLQEELAQIRNRYPHTTIVYADYYNASMSLYRNPKKFGFEVTLPACCGGQGPYNTELSVYCGSENATVCSDPSVYVCWDGVHFTEAAYKIMAHGLLDGTYAVPALGQTCSLISAY